MQFKTLAVALVASVAVASADMFENTPCTQCAFQSLGNDTNCAALTPAQLGQLQTAFNVTSVNFTILQMPAFKSCVCDWGNTVFTASKNDPASACTSGATPICSANQTASAGAGIRQALPIVQCAAANATGSASAGPSATTGAGPKPTSGAVQALSGSKPYVLSVMAVGLATAIAF